MKKYIFLLNFLSLWVHAITLEEQYPDFFDCKTDTYIERDTGSIHGEYFSERNMTPCKKENSVAEFCVKDTFHGLPVTRIVIPDPLPVIAFYIDLPSYKVKSILKKSIGFNAKTGESDTEPTIKKDGKNKTILMCAPDEQ